MSRIGTGLLLLLLVSGCRSALVDLSTSHERFLTELEGAMPAAAAAQEAALRTAAGIAQRQEDAALVAQRAAEVADALDAAIAGARLNLDRPTRDALRDALERMVAFRHQQRRAIEAVRAAREARLRAVLDALGVLGAAVPPMVAHQRTLTNYLEAHRGLPPLGGVSIAEPIGDVGELIKRLKAIGEALDDQFARAREIFEAAKAAAGEE